MMSIQLEGIRSRVRIAPSRENNRGISDRYRTLFPGYIFLILQNEKLKEVASKLRFVASIRTDEASDNSYDLVKQSLENNHTVYQALEFLYMNALELVEQRNFLAHLEGGFDLTKLTGRVPQQQLGPIKLGIRNNRLSIERQPPSFDERDSANIKIASGDVLRRGHKLIEQLKASNADPRFIAELEDLHVRIAAGDNIIQAGLSSVGCNALCLALSDEMSPTLNSLVAGHLTGVDMYLSQFSDWSRFVEQAAMAHLDADDISTIANAARKTIAELRSRPDLVEPDVPATFNEILQLLSDPRKSGKRAAFALLRSIENLVSKLIMHTGALFEKTASKTVDQMSTVAAGALVVGFLTIAVNSATGVGAIAQRVSEFGWLRNVVEVVQNHLNKTKNIK